VVLNTRYKKIGKAALLLSPVRKVARNQILDEIRSGKIKIVETNCPQCQHQESERISEVDFFGLPTTVSVCLDCGLVYSSRRMSDESLKKIYSHTLYGQIDRGSPEPRSSNFERSFLKGENIFHQIMAMQLHLKIQNVLDIGCGTGGVLSYFKSRGCSVTGLDLGYENIQFGRNQHGLNLFCSDINDLDDIPKSPTYFDLVILEQTLEHFSDPISTLQLLRKRLKPDGLLYIGVPGFLNIRDQYDGDLLRYIQFPHLVHFSLTSLKSVLGRAGFRVIWGTESISVIAQSSSTKVPQVHHDFKPILDYVAELKSEFWSMRRIAKRILITHPIYFLGYLRALYTGKSH